MCNNGKNSDQRLRYVGDAEKAANNGDTKGYAAAGGWEGDKQREFLLNNGVPGSGSMTSSSGMFSLLNLPRIGAGKLKYDESAGPWAPQIKRG